MTVRDRFVSAVANRGGSTNVARELGITRAYVDMIAAGQRTPGLRVALRIEEVLGIEPREWLVVLPPRKPAARKPRPDLRRPMRVTPAGLAALAEGGSC